MKQLLLFLSISLCLIACNSDEQTSITPTLSPNLTLVRLEHIIPSSFPGSLKAEKIREIVNNIDIDTTLIVKQITDSSSQIITPPIFYLPKADTSIFAFYKNKQLQKVVISAGELGQRSESFYYINGELIHINRSCSSMALMGSCDAGSVRQQMYFYQDSLIHEQGDRIGKGSLYVCFCISNKLLIDKDSILDRINKIK